MADLLTMLDEMERNEASLYQKDFLLTWDKSAAELELVLSAAAILKEMHRLNLSARVFESGLAVSQFRDHSTRTRFSFASAANLLGLAVQDLDETKSQIAHGETVRETSNMISFLTEVIGIRDDMYLGAGHRYMVEVAEALDDGYENGVLAQRPSVVNLQCDMDHPTQAMADLSFLKTEFGSLEALKGRKIAMTWAYSPSYGKPLSVPQGIIALMARMGMQVTLAHPEGYDLLPQCLDEANRAAGESGGSFEVVNTLEDAFEGADFVYPKSWAPLDVMRRRTELLEHRDMKGLERLEQECLTCNAQYRHWTCTESNMMLTNGGKGLYMHCLPADISDVSCAEGEVDEDVFERFRVKTYQQASHKPFVIAAMMLTSRFKDPQNVLRGLVEQARRRVRS